MKKVVVLTAVLFLMSLAGAAQADSSIFGIVQSWWSYTSYSHPDSSDYDATQTGFGVRRARVGWKYSDGGDFAAKFQGDGAGGTFKVLDAFGVYNFHEKASLTAGRFIGVGSLAGGLTSATKLDLIERSIVGRRWGAATIGGDYRTIGAQLDIRPNDMVKIGILAHNGSGSYGSDFTPSGNTHGDPTALDEDDEPAPTMYDTEFMPQLDFGVSATPADGVKLGLTYGLPNEFRNTTGSMTAFLYYMAEMFYFKFDYASLMNNPVWDDDDADYTSTGFAFTGGYDVNENVQLVGRWETWDADTDSAEDVYDKTTNLTFGANYYPNPDARYDNVFKAAFTYRMDELPDGVDMPDPVLFQLAWFVYVH